MKNHLRLIYILFLFISYHNHGFSTIIHIDHPISEKEFIDRTDITEINFSSAAGVTEIPDYAFLGCENLKKVILPEGLSKIGYQAFSECENLEEINFPESLEDIGSNAFTYCRNLKNPTFPSSLRHIGHNAFSFCDSLTDIYLPDSLEEIESYAFSDCAMLKSVRLPSNDRLLGELMMNCCPNLTLIIEPSVNAPKFDCDSFIFDPDDKIAYERCTLNVDEKSIEKYIEDASWSLFRHIQPIKR